MIHTSTVSTLSCERRLIELAIACMHGETRLTNLHSRSKDLIPIVYAANKKEPLFFKLIAQSLGVSQKMVGVLHWLQR